MTEEYHRSMVFSIHRFIMRLRNMLAPDSLRYEKPKSLDLSNQLAANSTTESESVDVEWIID